MSFRLFLPYVFKIAQCHKTSSVRLRQQYNLLGHTENSYQMSLSELAGLKAGRTDSGLDSKINGNKINDF